MSGTHPISYFRETSSKHTSLSYPFLSPPARCSQRAAGWWLCVQGWSAVWWWWQPWHPLTWSAHGSTTNLWIIQARSVVYFTWSFLCGSVGKSMTLTMAGLWVQFSQWSQDIKHVGLCTVSCFEKKRCLLSGTHRQYWHLQPRHWQGPQEHRFAGFSCVA